MPSLREIRRKVQSVKSTQQITKAMKMVASARLRRAQERILSARPFSVKMTELLHHLVQNMQRGKPEDILLHPLLQRGHTQDVAVLLVTVDKGLCGAFNTNLIKKTVEWIHRHSGRKVHLIIVGKKGRDYFQRLGLPIETEMIDIMNRLSYAHAEILGKHVIELYKDKSLHEVVLIHKPKYLDFKSFQRIHR